jgi:hypothetical protein
MFIERQWRMIKYGEVYLRAYDTVSDACVAPAEQRFLQWAAPAFAP